MLGQEGNDERRPSGAQKSYLRSVSWTDRSPTKPAANPRPLPNSKARSCLPPLQPLSIARRPVEEWPTAGSDDLGVWPNPQTPKRSAEPFDSSKLEKPPGREFQFKRDKLAFFNKECSRIADHIYLGSDAVAKNREVLRQNGITHVLNCVGFVCPEYFKGDLVYKTLWLQDSPSEDITSILYDVFDYFEDVREQGGRVLVHCCQGVSRSTSLVIAYLMWREGQSFKDAFQYVKAARGVTNPNMGFACQLLQCQKRVHAIPASPNSVLRMYRMAPHSSYDPLHLVPKMLSQPGAQGLDSRGAFVVHVPSTIFVWVGKHCKPVMSDQAKVAANQVIRYEKAQGPVVSMKEGEEPWEFWDALTSGQVSADSCDGMPVKNVVAEAGERRVAEYDLDYELFTKALLGGVVPPLSVSNTGSESRLPARENGWCRLRQKFADGKVKKLLVSYKLNCDPNSSSKGSDMIIDTCRESEQPEPASSVDNLVSLSSGYPCSSPESFHGLANISPDRCMNASKEVEYPMPVTDYELPSPSLCGSPDSFSCIPDNSLKSNYKSPTLSPSTSDYSSSSFTFSPSSSNWSDLSYLSSRQPSPSGLETSDPSCVKNAALAYIMCSPHKETPPSPTKFLSANHASCFENTLWPSRGILRSIAERRGSNPPPLVLPQVDEPSRVPRNLVRSWSFSLPDLEDDAIICSEPLEPESSGEEQMIDADNNLGSEIQDGEECHESLLPLTKEIAEVAEMVTPGLYQWPSMKLIDMQSGQLLDSGSMYILLVPDLSLRSNSPEVVYMWLGKEALSEEECQWTSRTSTSRDSHFRWGFTGGNLLNEVNLSANTPVEIVREGEEPQHFLNLLHGLSFGRMEDSM